MAGETHTPLVWTRLGPNNRGRRPGLTHARIARAATEIADAEGLDAVSMRRVATALGVGTMSLYRYVSSRDDLVDLMVDEAIGELTLDGIPAGDWRAVLVALAHGSRAMIHRHPWLAWHALGTRPSFGPRMFAWMERSTAMLEVDGLTIDQVLDMSGTVGAFVAGYTQGELAERDAQQRTGLSEQEWRARVAPYVMEVIGSGDYPLLRRIVEDAEDFPDPDEVFARRLSYVLDGLAAGLHLT
jgi:AcrR family transcriptional regulator